MAFFKKLKERLFKSSSKIDEGLDAIVEDGGAEETGDRSRCQNPNLSPNLIQGRSLNRCVRLIQNLCPSQSRFYPRRTRSLWLRRSQTSRPSLSLTQIRYQSRSKSQHLSLSRNPHRSLGRFQNLKRRLRRSAKPPLNLVSWDVSWAARKPKGSCGGRLMMTCLSSSKSR